MKKKSKQKQNNTKTNKNKIKKGKNKQEIKTGYYSFQQISDEFQKGNISLTVNETNGIALIDTPVEIKINKDLRNMLGFQNIFIFEANIPYYGNKFVYSFIRKYVDSVDSYNSVKSENL
jgi:hypothetical protein